MTVSASGRGSAVTTSGAELVASHVTKGYGAPGRHVDAIGDVSVELHTGEFISLVGPSGCGKSTLLRCLSGLARPDSGSVLFDGAPVDGFPASMAIVFQEYGRSLFPWLPVAGNVAFGLKHLGRREARARAAEALEMVGMAEFALHHPWQLSGGMQQRVAIARAIAVRPRCLLLDEPFASVDALTRESLEDLTLQLASELQLSTMLVTHDIDEAIFMSDKIYVLSGRPSRVLETIEVNLPRPRHQVETRDTDEFLAHRRHIHGLVTGRTNMTEA